LYWFLELQIELFDDGTPSEEAIDNQRWEVGCKNKEVEINKCFVN